MGIYLSPSSKRSDYAQSSQRADNLFCTLKYLPHTRAVSPPLGTIPPIVNSDPVHYRDKNKYKPVDVTASSPEPVIESTTDSNGTCQSLQPQFEKK